MMAIGIFKPLFFVYLAMASSSFFVQGWTVPHGPKPDPANAAATARWLACESTWGILSAISTNYGGAPFSNVASVSDGPINRGRGIPYFYLTPRDPIVKYTIVDQRASFIMTEIPIGTCGKVDPENPTCTKFTLIGKLKKVNPKASKEVEFARSSLFSKHPQMKNWPKDHRFWFYKLAIEYVFLIDSVGGPKNLTVDQYLRFKPRNVNTHSLYDHE